MVFWECFSFFPILLPGSSDQTGSNLGAFRALQKTFWKLHVYTCTQYHGHVSTSARPKGKCVNSNSIPHICVKLHASSTRTRATMIDDSAFHLVTSRSTKIRVRFHLITSRSNCGSWNIPLFHQYRCQIHRKYVRFHLWNWWNSTDGTWNSNALARVFGACGWPASGFGRRQRGKLNCPPCCFNCR